LREDPELYEGYKSNIAMAFKNEVSKLRPIGLPHANSDLVHRLANNAAANFLESLIRPVLNEI
jgi:hypothetical protein